MDLDSDDDEDDGGVEATYGTCQETQALKLAATPLSVDEDVDRLVALARHPSRSDRPVTTRIRAHSEDEDPTVPEHPRRGGDTRREIARIRREHPELFLNPDAGEGTGNTGHPAKGPKRREREERRARDDHKLDITDLHPSRAERGEFRQR